MYTYTQTDIGKRTQYARVHIHTCLIIAVGHV